MNIVRESATAEQYQLKKIGLTVGPQIVSSYEFDVTELQVVGKNPISFHVGLIDKSKS